LLGKAETEVPALSDSDVLATAMGEAHAQFSILHSQFFAGGHFTTSTTRCKKLRVEN
jgi:hypothetical protein